MNLTKNQIYIISAIIVILVAYYLFRKKPTAMAKIVAPPATTPATTPSTEENSNESGFTRASGITVGNPSFVTDKGNYKCWDGKRYVLSKSPCVRGGWLEGAQSKYAGSEIDGGVIESGYDGIAPANIPPASSPLSLGTDWLAGASAKSSDFIQQ